MVDKQLLLGDEAVALGALHAGLSGVYAYPGTPSTEITEYIQGHPLTAEGHVHNVWSSNEKTAMEGALGMSYAGKRALVCMKHVGMNVCADPLMGSAMTGANGGLVVAACDDPSMHSSQNEQDSRFWGTFGMMPVFEPSSQQEAYEMTRAAYDYSEENTIPVIMRLTTRMAHSRAVVTPTGDIRPQNELHYPEFPKRWVTLPVNARVRNRELIKLYAKCEADAVVSKFNRLTDGPDHSMGVIACGIAYNYLMENYPDGCPYPVLKVSQYPFPRELALKLADMVPTILVLEEGQP
ncbi:MAG: indolepyruvate ferredoxin oxidoreductase, partial [Bacteroidales bacterium]|nr:indolepyruvate ferredoxin oxidoreductase [Bacteroidales bacterium]